MAVAWCGVWLVAVKLWRGWWRRGPGVGGGGSSSNIGESVVVGGGWWRSGVVLGRVGGGWVGGWWLMVGGWCVLCVYGVWLWAVAWSVVGWGLGGGRR